MIDQPRASRLAKEGFDLWQSGQTVDAIPLYEEALRFADPEHYGLSQYHGEFGGVLATVGKHQHALEQYRLALEVQRRQDKDELSSAVVIARYFLAEQYLRLNEPQQAIETIEPSLKEGVNLEWLLRYTKAMALQASGRIDEALVEANSALAATPSKEKRDELSKLFAECGLSDGTHG